MTISWFSLAGSSFHSSEDFDFLKMSVILEQYCVACFNYHFLLSFLWRIITLIKNFNFVVQKIPLWHLYILYFFTPRAQMKVFDKSNIILEVYFCPFIQWCQVWILLLYGCLFLLFYYLFLFLCSNSVPTRFLLGANRFCSDPTRFILYYVRNFHGSLQSVSLNQQLKNGSETTQNKKKIYHNWCIKQKR